MSGRSKAYSQLPTSLPQGPGRYLPTMSWWHSSQGAALLKTCSWKLCSLTGLSGAKGRGTGHGEGVGVGRPLSADAGGGEGGGSGVGGVSSTSVGHFSSEPERRKKFSTLLLRRMVLRDRERLNLWSWEKRASYECLAGGSRRLEVPELTGAGREFYGSSSGAGTCLLVTETMEVKWPGSGCWSPPAS